MAVKAKFERVAFSPGEFAALFGKSQTWGYRQIYAQKVKAVTDHGRILIPAAEVDRILDKAGMYSGLKPKVPKKDAEWNGWREFVERRRTINAHSERRGGPRLKAAKGTARTAALRRLLKSGK
jgi:hypothetical protein